MFARVRGYARCNATRVREQHWIMKRSMTGISRFVPRDLLERIAPGEGKRIAVGVSGGVDSAMAAALLKARGWDVVGT